MIDEKKLIENIRAYFLKNVEKYLPEDKDDVVAGENFEKSKELLYLNKAICGIIESQPKVGEWTPCSERMPKENGRYLTTVLTTWVSPPETDSYDLWYEDGKWYCDEGDILYEGEVIAWQPVPEPYREDV